MCEHRAMWIARGISWGKGIFGQDRALATSHYTASAMFLCSEHAQQFVDDNDRAPGTWSVRPFVAGYGCEGE